MLKASIRDLRPGEPLPLDLMLLADPSVELIAEYSTSGISLVAELNGETVGIGVVIATRPATWELVNLAVRPDLQGKGLGTSLIYSAIDRVRALGAKTLEVGTGNSSLGPLKLYQRCGFRIVGVDCDYFVRHYAQPIVENGIPCRDMIRLAMELS